MKMNESIKQQLIAAVDYCEEQFATSAGEIDYMQFYDESVTVDDNIKNYAAHCEQLRELIKSLPTA